MNPVAILGIMIVAASAEDWRVPPIALPKTLKHPVIAATPEELSRLRAALKAAGPAHDAVAGVVRQADAALANPIAFPPRGGQHNQWYQCDKCQLALKTLDDTHHECPRCKTVYSGEPYDDVVYEHQHYANIRNASNAAWAYALTGEKRYADFAAKVLLGYAERYLQYPYHSASRSPSPWTIISGGRLFEQTLNEAASLASDIAPACDLIWDALSDADRAAIRDGLLIPMLKNMDKHKAGKGNWQTWHNAGMIAGGAVLGDLAWVEKAIAQPHNGFVEQMKVSVSDEGMWYENSWGYHFYTLHAMTSSPSTPAAWALTCGATPRFARCTPCPSTTRCPTAHCPAGATTCTPRPAAPAGSWSTRTRPPRTLISCPSSRSPPPGNP
ncbi:MAG TPA: alginate lyase family protein [Planctomycetota bacterium]|nr:alginate lyase family protein [Planctomycetota bacterium]